MSRSLVTIAVVAASVLAAVAYANVGQGGMHDCYAQSACRPWSAAHHTCKRKEKMDLRFSLDVSSGYQTREWNGTQETAHKVPSVPWFFCPEVDMLAAYALNHSAEEMLLNKDKQWDIDTWSNQNRSELPHLKYKNITVFGMGSLPLNEQPKEDDDSWVTVVELNSTLCPKLTVVDNATIHNLAATHQPAMVHFLVLNFTMTEGEYKYAAGFNQPIQSGFMPTCDITDRCKLFDDGVCIGTKKGKKNCAKCVSSPAMVLDDTNNIDLKIWASYYGSDSTGRKFMSGGENPLAFEEFSAEPVFQKVGGEVGDIERKL